MSKVTLNPDDVRKDTITVTAQLRLINDQYQLLTAEELQKEAEANEHD